MARRVSRAKVPQILREEQKRMGSARPRLVVAFLDGHASKSQQFNPNSCWNRTATIARGSTVVILTVTVQFGS